MLVRLWKDLTKSVDCESKTKRFLASNGLRRSWALLGLLRCDDPATMTTEELLAPTNTPLHKDAEDDDRRLEPDSHEGREVVLILKSSFLTAVFKF